MKTILITGFHPHISRNILSSDIVPLLFRQRNLRIVVATPEYRAPYLTQEFADERVVIAGVPVGERVRPRWGSLFQRLSRTMLDTATMRLKAGAKRHLDGRWGYYYFLFLPFVTLGHSRRARSFVRRLDSWFGGGSCYAGIFDAYAPDLVFSTDVQDEYDLLFMREARRRGIPVVSRVRSWDNLTQWGLIRHIPDQLLVPTEFVRDEAIRYHDVPRGTITVVGIPHYDAYFRLETESREAFFKSAGLDPSKKLIVYAPIDDRRMRANDLTRTWMENDLDRYILEVFTAMDANIWVRFPPNIPVTIGDFRPPPRMVFDRPGVRHGLGDMTVQDLSPEDDRRLRNILRWCDLVVTGPSTMAIDAAIFDKPVILVNFTPTPRDFWHGIIEYGYNHIQKLLSSGGVRVVESRQELEEWMRRYLDDPALDREGRHRLVCEQCGRTDGRSSLLVSQALLWAISPLKSQEEVVSYCTPEELKGSRAPELRAFYSTTACYGFDYNIETFEKYEYIIAAPRETRRLLDCGTGGGHFLVHLAGTGHRELYGFDIGDYRSERALSAMREFRVLDASMDRLPWPDGFFDLATAWCLLAHLENPHHFIRELSRVLKPGGYFFNVMPHIGSLRVRKNFLYSGDLERYTTANDHVAVFTPAIYQKTVLRYFEPVAVEYYVDPRIYQNRLGRLKRWGVEARWFGQRKFREWFAANVFYVLRRKAA